MKSTEKSLTRNFHAQELELFCHNRFYGPLVVAYNYNKPPYYLMNFTLPDLASIEAINRNFHNKSVKDDSVPACLLSCKELNEDLNGLLREGISSFTFYMFKYKTAWCPNKKDSHDSKSCVFAHHLRDFRRPPDLFKYQPEDCETLIKGLGWDKCPNGVLCPKCHTTVERLYHPDKYKRIYCDRSRCNKTDICAFFHNPKERQQANKECRQYRKFIGECALNVEALNASLFVAAAHSQLQPQAFEERPYGNRLDATPKMKILAVEEYTPQPQASSYLFATPERVESFSTGDYPMFNPYQQQPVVSTMIANSKDDLQLLEPFNNCMYEPLVLD